MSKTLTYAITSAELHDMANALTVATLNLEILKEKINTSPSEVPTKRPAHTLHIPATQNLEETLISLTNLRQILRKLQFE